MLITGRPAFERVVLAQESALGALEELQAVLSDGLGAVAGIPPQVAQSPIATTIAARRSTRSATHCFIGRPAKRFHWPVPFGAFTTVPSNTKMSSGISPATSARSIFCRFSPSSMPSEGCHSTLMPKSVTRSQALGSSALRNDMVLPEHAPP